MRGFPVVYTRTKYKDYPTELLVRPFDLHDDAYKKISNSILRVGNNIRRVVFKSGIYCVWGISTTTTYIYNLLCNDGHDVSSAKEYLVEESDRPIPCFFGYAIPLGEGDPDTIPCDDDYALFKMYIEQIQDVWEAQSVSTKITGQNQFYELKTTTLSNYKPSKKPIKSARFNIYLIPDDSDEVLCLYDYFTTKILSGKKLSFITGINSKSSLDRTVFENLQAPEEIRSEIPNGGLWQKFKSSVAPKNFRTAAIVAAAVAAGIIIAALLILFTSNSNSQNPNNQGKNMDTNTVVTTMNTQMAP